MEKNILLLLCTRYALRITCYFPVNRFSAWKWKKQFLSPVSN